MTSETRRKALYYGAWLLVVAAFWGLGNPLLKMAVTAVPPFYCLAIRFTLSFVIYLLIFYKRVIPNLKKEHIKPIIAMSLPMAGAFITAAFAMKLTTATNAGFFMSTVVIFTPILAYFFLKTKLEIKTLSNIFIVVVGIFLLSTASGSISINPGDAIAILCAVSGAGMFIVAKKFVHDIDPILLTVMQVGACAGWCIIFALIFEDFPALETITPSIWASLFFMASLCTCLAFVVQNVSLKHVSENYVALIFSMEPVFGAVASFLLLGEMLNAKGLIGAAIILAGVIYASVTAGEESGKAAKTVKADDADVTCEAVGIAEAVEDTLQETEDK